MTLFTQHANKSTPVGAADVLTKVKTRYWFRWPLKMTTNLAVLAALGGFACHDAANAQTNQTGDKKQMTTITLDTNKVYEIAQQWFKPDGAPKIQDYFGKVMPTAQKYGVRIVGRFQPLRAIGLASSPQVIGIAEWPSPASFDSFMADPEYRKLYPLRDEALEKLNVTHVKASAEASLEIKEGAIYEITGLWVRPDGGNERLQKYFEQVTPIAAKHGGRPLARFITQRAPFGDFQPTFVGFTEWPSLDAFEAFQNDPAFLKLKPMRDGALSKLVVMHGNFHVMPTH